MRALSCLLLLAVGCGRLNFDPLATEDAAGPADAQLSACGNYLVAHVPSFTTSSTTFVDVPGGALDLPAGGPWLVFASAGLRSTSSMQHSIEVRLRDDGTARTSAENQNVQNKAMPWVYVDLIAASRIDVQVRDVDGMGTIENLALVAYRFPSSGTADAVISQFTATQVVGSSYQPVVAVTVSPTTTANFLVLATGVISEEPSMSDINVQLSDTQGGTIWPMPANGTNAFANSKQTWRSVIWARQMMLSPGARTFRVEAASSGSSGSVRDMRIMVLPGDPLGLSGVEDLAPANATTSQPVVMSKLTLPAPSVPTDVVTLQLLTVSGGPDASGANPMVVDVLRDGVDGAHYENFDPTGAPVVPFGHVDAFTTTAETTLSNQFGVSDAARVVTGKESQILVFSSTCP